jgi:NADH dehydrogenase
MKKLILTLFVLAAAAPLSAQRVNLDLPGLGDKAAEVVDVTLDGPMLRLAAKFLSNSDPDERAARCTFVVVGAGYTGTEVTAQGQLLTREVVARRPGLRDAPVRWLLLDTVDSVLPGMDDRLSATAARVLRERGIELGLGTSVKEAASDGVHLTDGRFVPSRTLVWCVGVRPDPLAQATGLPLEKGRLKVDEYLQPPGHPEVFALGDGAAVPDPKDPSKPCPTTAQHAVRQAEVAARNVAASFGVGERRPYRHKSLGFVVDLGGWSAAANPLGVPLSGPPARALARVYHLVALPANRARTAAEWLFTAVGSRPAVQLGLVPGPAVPLDTDAPEVVHER